MLSELTKRVREYNKSRIELEKEYKEAEAKIRETYNPASVTFNTELNKLKNEKETTLNEINKANLKLLAEVIESTKGKVNKKVTTILPDTQTVIDLLKNEAISQNEKELLYNTYKTNYICNCLMSKILDKHFTDVSLIQDVINKTNKDVAQYFSCSVDSYNFFDIDTCINEINNANTMILDFLGSYN